MDAEPEPALPASEAGCDVQQSVAQRLRLGFREIAVPEQVLGPGSRSTAGMTTVNRADRLTKSRG